MVSITINKMLFIGIIVWFDLADHQNQQKTGKPRAQAGAGVREARQLILLCLYTRARERAPARANTSAGPLIMSCTVCLMSSDSKDSYSAAVH